MSLHEKYDATPFDEEEAETMEFLESGNWEPDSKFQDKKSIFLEAAKNTLKRDARVKLGMTKSE